MTALRAEYYPLLSGKAFADFSPEQYHKYVCSLYREPERTVLADFRASRSVKGVLTIKINRTPQFLTTTEVDQIAQSCGLSKQEAWFAVRKRGFEVRAKCALKIILASLPKKVSKSKKTIDKGAALVGSTA